jgi:REP element-mobilizing transposase RayT
VLLGFGPTMTVSEAVKLIKGGSSLWLKAEFPGKEGFAWQDGYGAFTVSASNVEEVAQYIRNQKEHHRHRTFQEEYIAFLKKHGVSYDERYVFD